MRATADNQQVAQSLGVSVKGIFALSWCIATVVSALGGIILGSVRGGVDFSLADLGLKVFPVVILGGLDSVAGAHHRRRAHRRAREPLGRLPRSGLRRRGEGGRAVRRARGHPHDPALRPLRQGRRSSASDAVRRLPGQLRLRRAHLRARRLPIVGLVVAARRRWRSCRCFAGTYWLDVLNRIGIAIIGALGLNILVGYTGQISIGHAAFLAVGAYATAILEAARPGCRSSSPSRWPALLTSVFGLVFGIPLAAPEGASTSPSPRWPRTSSPPTGSSTGRRMTNGVLGFNVPPATLFGLPARLGRADLLPDLRAGRPGGALRQEPLPHPGGPRVHRDPRPGRGGRRSSASASIATSCWRS